VGVSKKEEGNRGDIKNKIILRIQKVRFLGVVAWVGEIPGTGENYGRYGESPVALALRICRALDVLLLTDR